MLSRFHKWLEERRARSRDHDAAWSPVIMPGPDGISPFLRSATAQLSAAVPDLELALSGSSELFYQGVVPGTDAVVYLYSEGAQIHDGPNELFWAEYHDYRSPEELMERLVSRVLELQPNNSSKPTPLRGAA